MLKRMMPSENTSAFKSYERMRACSGVTYAQGITSGLGSNKFPGSRNAQPPKSPTLATSVHRVYKCTVRFPASNLDGRCAAHACRRRLIGFVDKSSVLCLRPCHLDDPDDLGQIAYICQRQNELSLFTSHEDVYSTHKIF